MIRHAQDLMYPPEKYFAVSLGPFLYNYGIIHATVLFLIIY